MYTEEQQNNLFALSKKWLKHAATSAEVASLREALKFHEWRYSVENNPLISDYEYDVLYKQLESIELANPELVAQDSPTQRVSSDLKENFDAVRHLVPMLSLANSYNAEDLKDFDRQVKKLTGSTGEVEYVVEPKFDGGSIALIYEDDVLVRAATRGNGSEGEEMTPNARAIPSIPLMAAFSKRGFQKVELRGEALMPKATFKRLNQEKAEAGEELFANPRNSATGALRTKDANETRRRGLEAFIFQFGFAADKDGKDVLNTIGNHFDSIEYLGSLGFKVPKSEKKICRGIEEVIAFCSMWENKRDDYDYEIDGMVVKVNQMELQQMCGSTAHHPRWAMAYKFKAKQATTKLLHVEYQVGKVGSITPVAKVEPVQLAGVTVSSISLHNEEFIRSKDLRIGDTVLVERAGDVIPYIVKPMADLRDGSEEPIVFPATCPVNDTDVEVALVQVEGEAAWRCPNCVCGAQDRQKIVFHVSKDGMDIDGFGKSYVERFIEMGWLKDISDVYNLDYTAIAQLEGFGEKSAQNIRDAVEKAKGNLLSQIIQSLSIHHVGKRAAKLLSAEIGHLLDLADWDKEKFLSIRDIGPVVADNMMDFLSNSKNIEMLQRMEERGVDLRQKEGDKPNLPAEDGLWVGKSILFTGSLQKMTRTEAQELASKIGARNISAVSSKLDILVVGENAGSKLKKAEALGTVTILTEEEFLKALESNS